MAITPSPSIVGHAALLGALQRDLTGGNVSHAYLFAGPPHVGKLTVAKWFASTLLAQGVDAGAREAVQRSIDRLLHPDLLILDELWIEDQNEDWARIARSSNVPQEHRSKGERTMRTDTIGIEDIRVLQDRFYSTGSGSWRVCIIRGVERMQDEAANALLKILEEPPPGRVFLLTTESLESLLPTVVSRARVLHFHPVPTAQLLPLVKGLPSDEATFLLHLAQGAPGVLRTCIDDPDALRAEKTAHGQAIHFWTSGSLLDRVTALEPLWKRGPEADRFLLHLALALREAPLTGRASCGQAFLALCRDLQTNAHRQLLAIKFAYDVDAASLLPTAQVR